MLYHEAKLLKVLLSIPNSYSKIRNFFRNVWVFASAKFSPVNFDIEEPMYLRFWQYQRLDIKISGFRLSFNQ